MERREQPKMRKALICLALAVGFGAPALGATVLPPDLLAALQMGGSAAALAKALSIADAYIAAHPQDGVGYSARCEIRARIAEEDASANASAALADCQRAVQLSPNVAFTHSAYGDYLYDAGSYPDALAQYTAAVSLGQTDFGIFWKRCDALRRVGRLADALDDCNKQIELTPNDGVAYYTRGRLEAAQANYQGAISDLTIALRAPNMPFAIDALYWRGVSYESLRNYVLADDDFTAAIGRGDGSPDTYFQRAQALQALNRPSEAAADLKKASDGYRAAGLPDRTAALQSILSNAQSGGSANASGTTFQFESFTFDATEVAKLFDGLRAALDPKDKSIHLNMVVASPSQMPAYETTWHYAGVQVNPDGTPTITLLFAGSASKQDLITGVEAGTFLGLAQSGYAGTKWKAAYDAVAAADARLGSNAADPFQNRRTFALQLAALYERLRSP